MIDAFIKRWEDSAASERANYQLFLTELCAGSDATPSKADTETQSMEGERPREPQVPPSPRWGMWGETQFKPIGDQP